MSLKLHKDDLRQIITMMAAKARKQEQPERIVTFLDGLKRADDKELLVTVEGMMTVSATVMKAELDIEARQEASRPAPERQSSSADWN